VRNVSGIVASKAVVQIVRKPDVMALRVGFANENIDVRKSHRGFTMSIPDLNRGFQSWLARA
jgi:hypothetical protein